MNTRDRRRKCLHCRGIFLPDFRRRLRQRFCSAADCRKARKQASQKSWLAKPGNENYFRDKENAKRARDWQKAHPGYWKKTNRANRTLQDACPPQVAAPQGLTPEKPFRTLQDLCSMQTPLFVGLIAMLGGSTLQDDIELTTRQLVAKGHDILGIEPRMNFERFHDKTCPQRASAAQSSAAV